MKLTSIKVDIETIGKVYLLAEVMPIYRYINGKRTEEIEGYRYTIVLPEKAYERIDVKVLGQKMIELGENDCPEVEFAGLELFIMWQGEYKLAAKAKGIRRKQLMKKNVES